jgi:hypothetical protein
MKPYHKLLREVRDSLTAENWDKKCLNFSTRNNNLYGMSAHGAAQRLVNLEVKKALEKNNVTHAKLITNSALTAARVGKDNISKNDKDHFSVWKNRPDWVKYYIWEGYGNLNLHYLMGMFGLTWGFEIQDSTTLDMIQEKLSEAAMWAEENEEFLVKNS